MNPEKVTDGETDVQDVLPLATQQELDDVAKLRASHPNLYENYCEYFAHGQRDLLRITLSSTSKDGISKTKPLPDVELHLRIVRMDPQARANFLRRIHSGYEAARLIGSELTVRLFVLFEILEKPDGFDEKHDQ